MVEPGDDLTSAEAFLEAISAWSARAPRFRRFASDYDDKIRKKIRGCSDPESLLDLWLELETAYRLLSERSLSLAYEPTKAAGGRAPDFEVTFTTSASFILEVARMRPRSGAAGESGGPEAGPLDAHGAMVAAVVARKLAQLAPGRPNVLLIGAAAPVEPGDVASAMVRLQRRAEGGDAVLLERHGFRNASGFFRRFQRLSGVIVRRFPDGDGSVAALWQNPQARHTIANRVRAALARSQAPLPEF